MTTRVKVKVKVEFEGEMALTFMHTTGQPTSLPVPPAALDDELHGVDFTTTVASLVSQAPTNAIWSLYNGRYVIDAYVNAWMATQSNHHLRSAITYAQNIIAAATDMVLIDDPAGENANSARPRASAGAIDAGIPYQGWPNAQYLRQGHFALRCYRLAYEVLAGVARESASEADRNDVIDIVTWCIRNVSEKFMTTTNLYNDQLGSTIERAAARDQSTSTFTGYWSGTFLTRTVALAYIETLAPLIGEPVPSWMAGKDYNLWANIIMQNGPAIGPETGLALDHGMEWHNDRAYMDRNNPLEPSLLGGPNGWDTGHANLMPSFLMGCAQTGAGDQAVVKQWIDRYQQNAAAIIYDDAGVIKAAHWQDGGDQVFGTTDEHLGFIYTTWVLYGSGDAALQSRIEQYYDQMVSFEAGGKSTGHPAYSQSLARNTTSLGRAGVISAIAVNAARSRRDIFGA